MRNLIILILFSPSIVYGASTSIQNIDYRPLLIQSASGAAYSECENQSISFYTNAVEDLITKGKSRDEITDDDLYKLRKERTRFELNCIKRTLDSNKYKNEIWVKAHCKVYYLDRYSSLEEYVAGMRSAFIRLDGDRKIFDIQLVQKFVEDVDLNDEVKFGECIRGIERTFHDWVDQLKAEEPGLFVTK
ncbi:MAG: hypothetical protein COB94_003810 [Gammaproteobacteria bacterium]|nr:hypothetical protein [Gammaproteobacteria bacterium]